MWGKRRYLWECVKFAWSGSISLANAWAPLLGAAAIWLFLWLLGFEMIVPDRLPGLIVVGLSCLVAAWLIFFFAKLLFVAPYTLLLETQKQLGEARLLNNTAAILQPPQEQLLTLLANYQRRFAAHKLVVGRKNGKLHFDRDPKRDEGISLIDDLFGHVDPIDATRFEELMERMPPEYLRFYQETRLDSPFVVSVTNTGLRYLKTSAPESTKKS
jgi:hypothetical protein